jgi:CBS domain-containing protein
MSVGRICLRDVDLAEAGESVLTAASRMRERQVGTLVIVNEAEQPVGLVTDRDLAMRVLAAGKDPERTKVADVMTRDPEAIVEDAPIESALARMRGGSFRRLPVTSREGRLVGIVSLDDVLALLAEEFGLIGAVIEGQRPHPA